jgi:hypothetical protein
MASVAAEDVRQLGGGGITLGWREQFETFAGGRRTVELKVQRPPADVLAALREHFVSGGPFGATQDTEGVLEVEDRTGVDDRGCLTWIVIGVVVAVFTFGVGLIIVLLWAFTRALTQIRRLRFEASSLDTGGTRLVVAGYPYEVVNEAEHWIRVNLPVEDVGG